ncbi:hypothetical protein GCM10027456_59770 [Kineosporia babensis]
MRKGCKAGRYERPGTHERQRRRVKVARAEDGDRTARTVRAVRIGTDGQASDVTVAATSKPDALECGDHEP